MSVENWKRFLSTEFITFPQDNGEKASTEEPSSPWETFINAAVISQLAYVANPVEEFESHRDQYKTNLVLVKVINPEPLVDGQSGIRQRVVMGIAQQSGTNVPTIYFAMRGFDHIVHFITKFAPQAPQPPQAPQAFADDFDSHVHRGIYEQAKSIPDEIIRAYLKRYPCVITGHSLGGAIGTLMGLRILLNSHCSNYINVWEKVPKTSFSEDQPTDESVLKLSVVTFGAPLVADSHLAIKVAKYNIFHNFAFSGDPVMVLLSVFPALLELVQEKPKSTTLILKNLVIAAAIPTQWGHLLNGAIKEFGEVFNRIISLSCVNHQLKPFGNFYFYKWNGRKGILQIPKSEDEFLEFFAIHFGEPSTFHRRLNESLLQWHSIGKYVDIFTTAQEFPHNFQRVDLVPDLQNKHLLGQQLLQTICPCVITNAVPVETNRPERRMELQVIIDFPTYVPERLISDAFVRIKDQETKSDSASSIKYFKSGDAPTIASISMTWRTSVEIMIPVNNVLFIQKCDELVLHTIFGDVITMDLKLHYAGFIGALKDPTSLLLKRQILRVVLTNQSDLIMLYENDVNRQGNTESDDFPTDMLRGANTDDAFSKALREAQDLIDELLGMTRIDLLIPVFDTVMRGVRKDMGLDEKDVNELPARQNTTMLWKEQWRQDNQDVRELVYNSKLSKAKVAQLILSATKSTESLGQYSVAEQWTAPSWFANVTEGLRGKREIHINVKQFSVQSPNYGLRQLMETFRSDFCRLLRLDGGTAVPNQAETASLDDVLSESHSSRLNPAAMFISALILSHLQTVDYLAKSKTSNRDLYIAMATGTIAVGFGVLANLMFAPIAIASSIVMLAVASHRMYTDNNRHEKELGVLNEKDCDLQGVMIFPHTSGSRYDENVYMAKLKFLLKMAGETCSLTDIPAMELVIWRWLEQSRGQTFISEKWTTDPQSADKPVDKHVANVLKEVDTIFQGQSDNIKASRTAFLCWAQSVGLIGRIRSIHNATFTIGIVGLSRDGKSTLLERLFPGIKANAGSNQENRTLHLKSWIPAENLQIIDFPGSNEGSKSVSATTQQGISLLNCIIIIADGSQVHTSQVRKLFNEELAIVNTIKEANLPFLVCLTKADEVANHNGNKSKPTKKELKRCRQEITEMLEKYFEKKTWTIRKECRYDSNAEDEDRTMIKYEDEEIRKLVRAACFVTNKQRKDLDQVKPFLSHTTKKCLSDLHDDRKVWFESDVALWLKEIVPLIHHDAFRDQTELETKLWPDLSPFESDSDDSDSDSDSD